MMGTTLSPKLSFFVRFVRLQGSKAATTSNSLHNLSSPPNIPLPKWDTCPASQNVICRKKFLGAIQIFAAGLTANPYRNIPLFVFDSEVWAIEPTCQAHGELTSTRNATKSRTGFFRLRLMLPPASKPISTFRNVT